VTSQQAAAMLHAAGVTSPAQWIHFHEMDGGDEGYTNAVCLLEASGLSGECQIRESPSGDYYAMRFRTENGSIEITSPFGSVDRFGRRMVGMPADRLGGAMFDDRVSLTELGAQTIAGLRSRVSDETSNDPALD